MLSVQVTESKLIAAYQHPNTKIQNLGLQHDPRTKLTKLNQGLVTDRQRIYWSRMTIGDKLSHGTDSNKLLWKSKA